MPDKGKVGNGLTAMPDIEDVDFDEVVDTLEGRKSGVSRVSAKEQSDRIVELIHTAENNLVKASMAAYEFHHGFPPGWQVLGFDSLHQWATNKGIGYDTVRHLIKLAEELLVKSSYTFEDLNGIPLRKLRLVSRHAPVLRERNKLEDVMIEARHASFEDLTDVIAEASRPPQGPVITSGEQQQVTLGGPGITGPIQTSGGEPTQAAPQAPDADPRKSGSSEPGELPQNSMGQTYMPEGIYAMTLIPQSEADMIEEKINQGNVNRLRGRTQMVFLEGKKDVYIKVT